METNSSIQSHFNVEESFDQTLISWSWNNAFAFVYFIFGGIWNAIALSILIFGGLGSLPFVIIMLMMGIWILYYAAAQRYNKTTVILNSDGIRVKIGPVPYPGNKRFKKEEISQLYYIKRTVSNKNGTFITFPLHILDFKNNKHLLIENIETPEQASFLEGKIEKYFRIQNRQVEGEYGERN